MSFLAPLWLALAAGVAVPLAVHLLRRRSGARVEFPAVRYLLRAEQESSRRSRLHNLLLMLLRILVVLLVALAAARPVGRVGGSGHAPTAVAIVLDNSVSTTAVADGRRVFDALRAAARRVAQEASADDRVWLVTADSVVAGGSRAAVLAALDAVAPLSGAGTPGGAVARAAALVRGAGLGAGHLAVVTDAQAASWRDAPVVADVPVAVFAPGGRAPANAAVVGAAPRPPRWTPAGDLVMRFVGAAPAAAYRASLGGATLLRGTVPPAGERGYAEATARAAPSVRGWVDGVVALPPDELRQDDARHFAVAVGAPPRIAADPSAGPFAAAAVQALVESGRAAAGRDVLVTGADALARLPALIAAPTDPVRLGAANRALARAGVPWRFSAARTGEQGVVGVGDTAAARRIVVRRRYALTALPGAAADTVARVGGEPWIVVGPNYVVVASPLVPEATTLPVAAAFVPLVASLAGERLGGAGARVVEAAPGAPFTVPAGVDALVVGAARTPVAAGARRAAPREPGVYWFERAGARAGALVVNVEAEESVLERMSAEELARRVGARRGAAAPDGAALARLAYGTGGANRPLGAAFLIAAVAALVAETAVARFRGRGA